MGYWNVANCKHCGEPIHQYVAHEKLRDWSHVDGGAPCRATTWAEPEGH